MGCGTGKGAKANEGVGRTTKVLAKGTGVAADSYSASSSPLGTPTSISMLFKASSSVENKKGLCGIAR